MNEELSFKPQQKPYLLQVITDNFVVIALLFIAFISRIILLDKFPEGVNQDEAIVAINSKFLLESGRDMDGMSYPVLFRSWGYSQMSVFASYLIALSMKFFGYNIWSLRTPTALFSIFGLVALYFTAKKIFDDEKLSRVILLFGVVNPWLFMSSRWSLEATYFPHMFLIAFCLMLYGLDGKKWKLYLSMAVFGLSLYTYCVSIYIVPVFLLAFSIYLLKKKIVNIRQILLCVGIFLLVGGPFILCMLINVFDLDTIKLWFMTIPRLSENKRYHDIVFFSDNVPYYAFYDIFSLCAVYLFGDFMTGNVFFGYGVIPVLLVPFVFYGIYRMVIDKPWRKPENCTFGYIAFLMWFGIANISGIITVAATVNRLNILHYTLVIFETFGIYQFVIRHVRLKKLVIAYSAVISLSFFIVYFVFAGQLLRMYYYGDYLDAFKYAQEKADDNTVFMIEPFYGNYHDAYSFSEVLSCYEMNDLTVDYYLGKAKDSGGLYYNERYRFEKNIAIEEYDPNVFYILRKDKDTVTIPGEYEIKEFERFYVLTGTLAH